MFFSFSAIAQEKTSSRDSVRTLDEVVVHAFAQDRPISETPGAIGYLTAKEFENFNYSSMLPAMNSVPGVRMEERSPGSYRFSIRGSLLRSPFGVRNVKMYWNGLPLTDAGGNTYLNLLDLGWIENMEIIRGPGASLYGAGTGGVVLFEVPVKKRDPSYLIQVGSYDAVCVGFDVASAVSDRSTIGINLGMQHSDGYREQTQFDRIAAGINWHFQINPKSKLELYMLTSSLEYETPGGLTLAQYMENPVQARPSTSTQPGAVDQEAAVKNLTALLGASFHHEWNEKWKSKLSVVTNRTSFNNPSIRNVEEREEDNIGARLETSYKWNEKKLNGRITWGGEFQFSGAGIDVYDNNFGVTGAPQTLDDIIASNGLGFAQLELDFPKDFFVTAGGSLNFLNYQFNRSFPSSIDQTKKFRTELSPRVALLKKINSNFSIYGNLSRGFSPPGVAEVRPSTNNFNPGLNAERGINGEVGIKGKALGSMYFEMAAYNFNLKESIVIQRTSDGADYFVNAGRTSQNGIEALLSWQPTQDEKRISIYKVWASYTYQHYRFRDYIQDDVDYSNNELTGVPPVMAMGGINVGIAKKMEAKFTCNFTDHIPLNDANTEYAASYILLGARVDYHFRVGRIPLQLFAGVDNALDEKYSLGNDLNAFGGRYYNAAPPRNYFAGVKWKLTARTP
jgi:iron complex outermembrane receptor protein